ncbi:hypothetical protein [Cyclobacterium jeungdonense]|uniref:Uncharacterized protein n=1 Tax=Cyclobacterium jeungdonense TaxID=708087 RepID=A0ABT8CBD7_9BACT|nr:hypothetical protein [Cyclobacterium jeungdonense]MDN3690128.1 hypothetical protein [Cyclobacterium jeungdonense]
MKTGYAAFVFLFLIYSAIVAQEAPIKRLFGTPYTLEVRLEYPFRELKKNNSDKRYFPTYLHYRIEKEAWDSVKIDVRPRGSSRREICFFTPIKLRIKAKERNGTLFEDHKTLKLVLPCMSHGNANDLILKEYFCYKLYRLITPYNFNTKLMALTLTDRRGRQSKSYHLKAFFIEDEYLMAKRLGGDILEAEVINPFLLQDTAAVRHDFFQYMIANTDWSALTQHNVSILQVPPRTNVPVPYDFDMSGLVNAPYAKVSELLPILSVRERLYRGFCREEGLFQLIRSEYLSMEDQFWEVLREIDTDIHPDEMDSLRKFLDEFYAILKNDQSFNENIVIKCRATR